MIKPEFFIFEILVYLLFLACLWHAWRQGNTRVFELITSLVYGVFLEWMTIKQLSAYAYGHFLVMFDGAPLAVGVGWAVIIYSGMEFVKQLNMPAVARPFLVGFMALNIDVAMDAIAIRQGFWTWAIPLDAQWFGVPWGNFWAWYIVVTSFSGLLYWMQTAGWRVSPHRLKRWGYAPLAFVGSVIILAFTNALFAYEIGRTNISGLLSMGFLLQVGALIVIIYRPRLQSETKLNPVAFAVPLVFHVYFNVIGFVKGYYAQIPLLGVIGVLMLITGMFAHLYPVWKSKKEVSTKIP